MLSSSHTGPRMALIQLMRHAALVRFLDAGLLGFGMMRDHCSTFVATSQSPEEVSAVTAELRYEAHLWLNLAASSRCLRD